jgi:predicted lipoprotein
MKKMKLVLSTIVLLLTINLSQANAQVPSEVNSKVQKATDKFCGTINTLISDLDALDKANAEGTQDELDSAYKKAVKSWNKFVKAGDNLEKVEIKKSVKSYDKLVTSINKVGDNPTQEDKDAINTNIDATASEIEAILSSTCK